MTGFGSFHPAVLFIYYVLALVFSMISMHPLLALASLCGSFLFYAFLNGGRKTLSQFFFCVGMFVIMAGINAMYVHNGETILFFMNDNPITLEALIYGVVSSVMLVSVLKLLQRDPDDRQVSVSVWQDGTETGADPFDGFSNDSAVSASVKENPAVTEINGTVCDGCRG